MKQKERESQQKEILLFIFLEHSNMSGFNSVTPVDSVFFNQTPYNILYKGIFILFNLFFIFFECTLLNIDK